MSSVLFITPFIWEAGPWKGKPTLYYIIRGFQQAGYDVHVICPTNKPNLHEAEFEGVHIHYFRIPLNWVDFEYDAFTSFLSLVRRSGRAWKQHIRFRLFWLQFLIFGTLRAMQVARRYSPDFTYGMMNTGIPVAYIIGRIWGVPNFSRITGSYILKWVHSPLYLLFIRFDEYLAFKLPCDGLIVTRDGSTTVEEIHRELKVPSERIWLLRNGIDKAAFLRGLDKDAARQQLKFPSDVKIVISVSQLVDLKRVDRIIDALPYVVERLPNVLFVIVGDGPLRDLLQQQAHDLGVASYVHFAGFVSRDKLPVYYHAADVFAAFYPYSNISNSLLEAMLSGNAVVTLNNGHTSEVVQHLENGFLIDPDYVDEIPIALTKLLEDAALRQRLSGGASSWANRELLTWDARIAREMADVEAIVYEAT